jgi:uncharacterized protein (TIGR02996 family)
LPKEHPVSQTPHPLLTKCKARPDDLKARWALADWLDSHKQAAWAKLVRLQAVREGPDFLHVDRRIGYDSANENMAGGRPNYYGG